VRLAALLLLAVIALPFAVRAEDTPQPGVTMTVYDGMVWPYEPWITPPDWTPCAEMVVQNIDFYWDGGAPAETCAPEFFIVHFNGWLTVPETGQYEWLNWSDDGWRMTLDGVLVLDDWNYHGCGGHWSGPNEGYSQLEAGVSYALDVWMFEWSGGACASLWYGSPANYGIVPTEWLTTSPMIPPTPSPEPTPTPDPTQTPEEPSPSPSVAPTPTPEPSVEPTPEPTPDPTPEPTEPPPTVAPTQEPTNEPTAQPTSPPTPPATPEPTPEGTVAPTDSPPPPPSVNPTPVPTPEPTQPALPDVGAAVAAVEQAVAEVAAAAVEAVGESVAAIGGGIADIAAIGEIGKDLDPAEKEEAQPMAVAVISSQIASVAAAVARGGASTPSGGNLGGGGGGGADAPKTRKTSSRKELK